MGNFPAQIKLPDAIWVVICPLLVVIGGCVWCGRRRAGSDRPILPNENHPYDEAHSPASKIEHGSTYRLRVSLMLHLKTS